MKVIMNYDRSYKTDIPTAMALGTFDGIHLGHRKLIGELHREKRQFGYQTMVYTFLNHPLQLLAPEKEPPRIMLLGEKIREFSKLGVDVLVLNPFDTYFSQQTPRSFLDHLYHSVPIKSLVVGFNFRFGYKGAGDRLFLQRESKTTGLNLVCVPPVQRKDEIVSSSLIRKKVLEGCVEDATELLTQPYSIRGKIVHGHGRGTGLGFPTANLRFSTKKVLPLNGVYLTRCELDNNDYWGLTSVGTNPTFSDSGVHIETYLLDCNENLYGQTMRIQFLQWMRREMKFNQPEDLIDQMERDRIKAKKLIYKKR